MEKFRIKKVGNYYVAFDLIDKKKSYGKIHVDTGKFIGNTICYAVLGEYQLIKREELINKVIKQIKDDLASNDITAIYKLLNRLPERNLTAFLSNLS